MGTDAGATQTVTTTNEPWGPSQAAMKQGFGAIQSGLTGAGDLYGTPRSYYPGAGVATQSAASLAAQGGGYDLARGAGQGAEYDYMNQVLGGSFLDPSSNPQLQSIWDQGASDITSRYQTAIAPGQYMGLQGRSGSGVESNRIARSQRELGDSLGDFRNQLFGGHYQQERQRQNAALGMSSMLSGSTRADIQTGAQMGAGADMYNQNVLNDLINRYNFTRDEPGNRLDSFINRISPMLMGGEGFGTQVQEGLPGYGGGGMTGAQGAGLGISLLGLIMQSSRAIKDELMVADECLILDKLQDLEIGIWKYSEEAHAQHENLSHDQHVGPYAEDWNNAFGLGNGKTINLSDGLGICLAAIKELGNRITELQGQVFPSPQAKLQEAN